MKNFLWLLMLINVVFSCKEKPRNTLDIEQGKKFVTDSCYVINDAYKKGDVRRYGVMPNKRIDSNLFQQCLSLAEEGLPLYFPKGTYNTSLVLKGVSGIEMNFEDVIITGAVEIINRDAIPSQNIIFNGKLTILDKLFIRESNTISFNEVRVISDTVANLYHKKNRGVSIYAGSKIINFDTLIIQDTGGSDADFYTHVAAAFQVHGWNNNPSNITIKEIQIKNAARTAMYLTGKNHRISKTTIINFGAGQFENMFGLEDVDLGLEKGFSGAWINKCNDCVLDSLSISNSRNLGRYSLNLGIGSYSNPTFINNINFNKKAKEMLIKDSPLTNILVKNTY